MSPESTWFFAPAAVAILAGLAAAPVRRSFWNGWLCLIRHDILWKIPAVLVLAYASFHIVTDLSLSWRLGDGLPPFWTSPPPELPALALDRLPAVLLPAAEMLAADLNCLTATFPLSALCGALFLLNWHAAASELRRALCRRFGFSGWLLFALLVVCACCALLKPLPLLFLPELGKVFPLRELLLFSTALNALSFVFEYLLGTAIQLLLLLTAYGWVRGLHFPRERLLHFAVRRLGFVIKWALVLIVATLLSIHLPLFIEVFFTSAPATLPVELFARPVLLLAMMLCATVQIRLALHNDSLRGALAANATFLRRHAGTLALFLLSAFGLFLTIRGMETGGLVWLEGTVAGRIWTTGFQVLAAVAGGWILASWVCFYSSFDDSSRKVVF